MMDWHSHFLPNMDDGSQSVEESLELLRQLKEQHIQTVIATPHFYAEQESIEEFLNRRQQAMQQILEHKKEDIPKILLGAEVRYYSGISRLSNLNQLCIEGTDVLLLEMSMNKWTEYIVKELVELAGRGNIRILLAHVERYFHYQSQQTLNRLYESGILMQMNAEPLLHFMSRRKALHMIDAGEIHAIGSDCHNLTSRAPKIGKAYEVIEKKLGRNVLLDLVEFGYSLLNL